MGLKFKTILKYSGLAIFIILLGLIIASPYNQKEGDNHRTVAYSIIIHAPVNKVFDFMGKSELAEKWSVYVDGIQTLNSRKIPDGAVGSKRRCFVHPLKNGQYWDEEVIISEKNGRRRLSIFNLVNFPISASGLLTEQLYKRLDNNITELKLTLFYIKDTPSFLGWLKIKLGAYRIKKIFKKNLLNIKDLIEKEYDE
jgi:hypothetical protein